jgi:hypothetical protein
LLLASGIIIIFCGWPSDLNVRAHSRAAIIEPQRPESPVTVKVESGATIQPPSSAVELDDDDILNIKSFGDITRESDAVDEVGFSSFNDRSTSEAVTKVLGDGNHSLKRKRSIGEPDEESSERWGILETYILKSWLVLRLKET